MFQSPTDMMKTSASVMKKLATWDRHEECWEIGIPLPSKVEVKLEDGEFALDTSLELHTILQENGIAYSTMGFKEGTFEVNDIRMM